MAPPDLRRVVRLFEVDLVRRRFGAATIDAAGQRIRGVPVDTAIRSTIWPTDGEAERDPDGQTEARTVSGVSRFELREATTEPALPADVVLWLGAAYELTSAKAWHRRGAVVQFWEWSARRVVLERDYPTSAQLALGLEVIA